MNKLISLISICEIISACSSNPIPTEGQMNAMGSTEKMNALCFVTTGIWGKVTTTYISADKGVITNGGVSVDEACKVQMLQEKQVPIVK